MHALHPSLNEGVALLNARWESSSDRVRQPDYI
jgi:hypothetical protein